MLIKPFSLFRLFIALLFLLVFVVVIFLIFVTISLNDVIHIDEHIYTLFSTQTVGKFRSKFNYFKRKRELYSELKCRTLYIFVFIQIQMKNNEEEECKHRYIYDYAELLSDMTSGLGMSVSGLIFILVDILTEWKMKRPDKRTYISFRGTFKLSHIIETEMADLLFISGVSLYASSYVSLSILLVELKHVSFFPVRQLACVIYLFDSSEIYVIKLSILL